MENKRGNEIFLGVVGVATLLVAIIGATFAYFTASAQSENEIINTASTKLVIGYWDNADELGTDMIPTTLDIAHYSVFTKDWVDRKPGFKNSDDEDINGQGLCNDEEGNEICGVYEFAVGNATQTNMTLSGSIVAVKNQFRNIKYAIYDEEGTKVAEANFPTEGQGGEDGVVIEGLDEIFLQGSALASTGEDFDEDDPTTYVKIGADGNALGENEKIAANVRNYKMIIWVDEINSDQTEADSGKILTATVKFKTAGATGVSGVIAAANAS